jgi:trigger factor
MATAKLISRERNIARVAVDLDAAEVRAHYQQMYRENAKDLRLPGFRPGKVPANIVRQRLGAEAIQHHMGSLLKEAALDAVYEQLNLTPRQGRLEWHAEPEPSEDDALSYEVSIPVLPEVALPDYASFEFKAPHLKVTDEMEQRYRERLRERFTTYTPVDGPAQAGQAVEVTFHSHYAGDDHSAHAPFEYEDMMYVIGAEGNLPGWDEILTGRSAGEDFAFDYTMPDNFADARLAGKALHVHAHVKSVNSVVVPELDEQFVKDHLRMDSLAQFDEFITATLQRESDAQAEQIKRELALARTVQEMQAEISEDMVEAETDGMVEENDALLRNSGSGLMQYLEQKGQSLDEYRASLREAALRRLGTFLVVHTLAEQQQFGVTSDDLRRYAFRLMHEQGVSPEQIQQLLQNRSFINEASYNIIRDKAVAHLVQQAKFEEAEPEDGAEASPAGAEAGSSSEAAPAGE